MLDKPTTLSTPLSPNTEGLSLFVDNYDSLYSVTQIPTTSAIPSSKFHGFVNKRYLIQKFCTKDNTWSTIYDSYRYNHDIVIWPICVVFQLLSLQDYMNYKSGIVESGSKVSLYFNLSVLVLIVIDNDIVQDIFELNKMIKKYLSRSTTTTTDIDILAISNIDDKCHLICRDETHNEIHYLTHNPCTKEFVSLFKQSSNSTICNHNLISNSNGTSLYHFEWNNSTFSSSIYQRKTNTWTSRSMIQTNGCHDAQMDSDFIWIKGDHFFAFKQHSICVLNLQSKTIKNIRYLENDDITPLGKYKAILQSETDEEIELKISGFTRQIIKSSDRYPPQYLIQLMMHYYSNEKIYLFRVYTSGNPCILWILNVDEILTYPMNTMS